jgi:hypothetical protein
MTRRGIILVLIVTFCALWQPPASDQAQSSEELNALITQLNQLYSQGNYAAAIPIAEKICSFIEKMYQEFEFWYPYFRMKEAGAKVSIIARELKNTPA